MSITLLIGGARSGKSGLAVEIGMRHAASTSATITYIATAPRLDDDMDGRIERHRAERPTTWRTIEEQRDLAGAIERAPIGLVIIDCLTLWTSNLMWADVADDEIRAAASDTALAASQRADPVVAITNEVGLGIVPDNEVARRYRDVHGWVNQAWARSAELTLHLVAGRAIRLDDPWDHLDGFV